MSNSPVKLFHQTHPHSKSAIFSHSGKKKFVVFVKNPKTGKVKKIQFGDVHGGLSVKIKDPKARKAFSDRHNCPMKKDKTTAGYWACSLPRYGSLLGLSNISSYW